MKSSFHSLLAGAVASVLLACGASAADGWQPLFNGKNLDGWKTNANASTFSVSNGVLIVKGPVSHIFYDGPVNGGKFTDFELRLEIMTKPGANSGVYVHTAYQASGFPNKGYEIQVNNSHTDPKRGGGVYGIKDNMVAPAKDNEWFTMEISVVGKRIVTKIDGKEIVDYTEVENAKTKRGNGLSSGTIAIQGHDPKSEIHYRKIEIKPLK